VILVGVLVVDPRLHAAEIARFTKFIVRGPGPGHSAGTQAENLAQMGRAGRGGGRGHPRRWYGPDRAARVARSRALRHAVRHGWDP